MEFFDFIQEYGMEIFKALFSIATMFIAWRTGKKSGSAKLLKDIKKLEDLEKKYNKEGF